MELDGVAGTGSCLGVLGEAAAADALAAALVGVLGDLAVNLPAASPFAPVHGGGYGDTDTAVTEAECA